MAAIFALDAPALLALAVACGAVSLGVVLALHAAGCRWAGGRAAAIPVPAYFAAVTTLWALTAGFVAADVWDTQNRARAAAVSEALTLERIDALAAPEALDLPALGAGLSAYRAAVAGPEWGAGRNAAPAPEVAAALDAMRRAILAAIPSIPAPVAAKLVGDFDQLQDARAERLALGTDQRDGAKWLLVVALTVLSQLAIAVTHLDRPAGGRIAVSLFTLAAVATLWLLALHADPYAGRGALLPGPAFADPAWRGAAG